MTMPADASGIRARRRFSYQTFYAFTKNSSGSYVQASTPVWRLTETAICLTGTTCSASADVKTSFSYGTTGVANNRALLTTTQDPGGLNITTSLAYDRWSNLLTTNGPLSGSADLTRLRYDTERRVIGSIQPDPDGAGSLRHPATRIIYDLNGLPIATESGTVASQSDAAWAAFAVQERLETTYDTAGRQTETRLKVGSTTEAARQFSYDGAARLQCVAERLNPATFSALPASACTVGTAGDHGPDRITKNVYDAAGQLLRTISALGTPLEQDTATYSYTLNGMAATFKDAKGNLTSFEYDGFDRLVERRYPDASNGAFSSLSDYESFTYDANGRVIEQFTRDGRLIGYSYDALGRVLTKNLPGSAADVTYSYDLLGRVLEARFTASGEKVTTVYDKASRVLSVTSSGRTLSYQYDAAGRRTRMTWPDGFYVTYSYDMLGRMTAVRENGAASGLGVLARYRYDDRGRRAELVRGNGTVTTYAYDALSRLTSLTQDLAGTGQDYDVDFDYSPASQIVARTQSNDSYGWTAPAPGTKTASHNDLNQTTTDAGTGLTYDDNGNLASQGSVNYNYDTENRLTQVSGATSLSLSYDPLGRLAQTSAGASVTGFLYDGVDMVAEYNATGTLVRRTVHGPATDEPLVWYEGSGTSNPRWLHADERGSIVAVSTASGSSIATYSYGPYGETASWSGSRFRYTGQMTLPEVGLYHYKARAYSAALGRFLQPDPIGLSGGLNLYAYANGDPINLTDPLGLAPEDCTDCIEIVVIGQPVDRIGMTVYFGPPVSHFGGFNGYNFGGGANVPRLDPQQGATDRKDPCIKQNLRPGEICAFRRNSDGETYMDPGYQEVICRNFAALQDGATKAMDGFTTLTLAAQKLGWPARPIVDAVLSFANAVASITTGAGFRPFGVTIIPKSSPPLGC